MNWRAFISSIPPKQEMILAGYATAVAFQPPASLQYIVNLEFRLGATLPDELRSLLLESDGVVEMLKVQDGAWFRSGWLIWPVSDILEQNYYLRRRTADGKKAERYCDRADDLLFIANAAMGCDGALLAHPVDGRGIVEERTVVWNPIKDELTEAAPTLRDLFQKWLG